MIRLSVRLGGYLELNFQSATGTPCREDGKRACLNIRLPRNEVSALLDRNTVCRVDSPDGMPQSFVIREVRPGRDWIDLVCVPSVAASAAGLMAAVSRRP